MDIHEIINKAIEEDVGNGDHTSLSTIPGSARGKAQLIVKEPGIIAGVNVARDVFLQLDQDLAFDTHITDGQEVKPGDVVFTISGNSRSILTAERLALNFMQRMSGIATHTSEIVSHTSGTGVKILDTRKTTPLMRELEKMAVRTGGGVNHRMGLYDMIMIKDNHVDFAGGIDKAIDGVHDYMLENNMSLPVEIEVRSFHELEQVLDHGKVDRIMLDNFSISDLKTAVEMIDGKFETEASGGITMENIREYALTGVDFISVGALTHHIKSLDMSLKAVDEV